MRQNSIFIIIFLLLSAHLANAQVGGFRVDTVAGCAPLTINIIDTSTYDPLRTRAYYYEYNAALPLSEQKDPLTATSFTYTIPGTYSIAQFISLPSGGQLFEQLDIVTVVEPTTPQIQLGTCQSKQIELEIIDNAYEEFTVNWGDGNTSILAQGNIETHTYASSGTFTIQVLGGFPNGGGNCKDTTLTIQAFDVLPRATINSAIADDAGNIQIGYTINDLVAYELQEKLPSGSYQTIQGIIAGTTSVTLTGKTASDGLCYRISTSNTCSGNAVTSNEICFLENTSISADVGGIDLGWNAYQGTDFDRYEIYRDNALVGTLGLMSQVAYIDSDLACFQNYCYQIYIQLADGTEISQFIGCATSISSGSPTAISRFVASVENNQLQLNWDLSSTTTPKSFLLFKTVSANTDSVAISGTSFTDTDLNVGEQIACYQLKLTDSCNNQSESIEVCNILLRGSKKGSDNLLEWQVPPNLVSFPDWALEILDENGNVIQSIAISTSDVSYTDFFSNLTSQVAYYRIRSTDTSRGLTVYSNIASIQESLEVQVPDAFTPDGDGLNDELEVFGNYIASLEVQIYNRWGQQVFLSDSTDTTWNGTYEGKKAPQGVYTYVIQGKDTFGNNFSKKGTVLLIRK